MSVGYTSILFNLCEGDDARKSRFPRQCCNNNG